MNHLEKWLQKLIREKGPISFRDFMYWALYHPEWGYYTREKLPFGKTGDFYTSPGVNSVFGETLAKDLYRKWKQLNSPAAFSVLEFGAGQGTLARDIVQTVEQKYPDFLSAMKYWIIEISEQLQNVQKEILQEKGVHWAQSLKEIGPFTGIILSNELIDAFPVHVLECTAQGIEEVNISLEDDKLVETLGPLSNELLFDFLKEYPDAYLEGQRFEVNLDALAWLEHAADQMIEGFVLTIDYGDETPRLYEGKRDGTIRAFKQHQMIPNLLASPGEQDLTADVNFTSLQIFGEKKGLHPVFYGTQSKFLIEAGILENLSSLSIGADPFKDQNMKRNLAIKHLIMPSGMGERFKVLVQQKSG